MTIKVGNVYRLNGGKRVAIITAQMGGRMIAESLRDGDRWGVTFGILRFKAEGFLARHTLVGVNYKVRAKCE